MMALTIGRLETLDPLAPIRPPPRRDLDRGQLEDPLRLPWSVRLALRAGMLLGCVNLLAAGYVLVQAVRAAASAFV